LALKIIFFFIYKKTHDPQIYFGLYI